MSEAKALLDVLIKDFSVDKFSRFFMEKSRVFKPSRQNMEQYNEGDFTNGNAHGKIEFPDGDSLIVCSFQVKKDLTERSGKKKQYDLAKKMLKNMQVYNAGIFIFYTQNGNFRFSLVYPESIGTRRLWNNFRRFTYFVDKGFTNKTFLKQIGEGSFDSLDKVKAAFSLMAVTDLFYQEFFAIYEKLETAAKRVNRISDEEKVRDFVLLFAIRTIFLGFIQKKRWIGSNDDFMRSFLKEYNEKYRGDNKFYKKWLTPLFFEALNTPPGRPVAYRCNDYSKETEAALKMAPYLNGGLFKEKPGYDDKGWYIPDKEIDSFYDFLFSHSFTIEENSMEDEELQLNPEFLGIIFERLVNKADGAVYTPRTEVDLMCRLSLVKWLQKNLTSKITNQNLYELFFKESENEEEQKKGSFSKKEAEEILGLLENLSICDPAVGSGAFLVGMMQVLDEIECSLKGRFNIREKIIFERKKEIIRRTLYGVEVKEWAVWICQLRLWLSLFVDTPDDLKGSLEPILPSLEFKVRQGDSLVQRIGSTAFPITGHMHIQSPSIKSKITELKNLKVEYFDNKTSLKEHECHRKELAIYEEIINQEIAEKEKELRGLGDGKVAKTIPLFGNKYEAEQKEMDLHKNKREKVKQDIAELREQKTALHAGDKPLLWSIEFAEIFAEKEGFDIVIGNPPYVRQEDIADPTGKVKDKKEYLTYLGEMVKMDFHGDFPPVVKINAKSDLYTYFYIRALRLVNSTGIQTFICSNSWLDVGYGVWLQEFLLKRCPVELIIDNQAKRSFEAADINTIITIIHGPQKVLEQNYLAKFVAFKKPFEEAIYTESLLRIETAKDIISNDVLRVYPTTLKALKETGTVFDDAEERGLGGGEYIGDKWGGKYLRAPDIYFTIMGKGVKYVDVFNSHFIGERYLNTGGADGFFILTNVIKKTANYYHVENDSVLKHGVGSFAGDIEAKYLKRLIKDQTKKEKKPVITDTDAWCLVLEGVNRNDKVSDYIKWGVKQGYNNRSVTKNQNPWYKPTNQMKEGAEILLPRSFNDIFVTYYNPSKYLSLRFYRLHPQKNKIDELISFLNTTLFWFIFETLGNKSQGQGVLDFYMEDFLKTKIPIVLSRECVSKFNCLKSRQVVSIFKECGIDPGSKTPIEEQEPKPLSDRAELDKIVFDALGLTKEERKEVYRAVCRLVWNRISKAKSV